MAIRARCGVRRACPVCGRREEIEHYGRVVTVDGVEYMADPQWRESEPNICIMASIIVPAVKGFRSGESGRVHSAPPASTQSSAPASHGNGDASVVVDGHSYVHDPACRDASHR